MDANGITQMEETCMRSAISVVLHSIMIHLVSDPPQDSLGSRPQVEETGVPCGTFFIPDFIVI